MVEEKVTIPKMWVRINDGWRRLFEECDQLRELLYCVCGGARVPLEVQFPLIVKSKMWNIRVHAQELQEETQDVIDRFGNVNYVNELNDTYIPENDLSWVKKETGDEH